MQGFRALEIFLQKTPKRKELYIAFTKTIVDCALPKRCVLFLHHKTNVLYEYVSVQHGELRTGFESEYSG